MSVTVANTVGEGLFPRVEKASDLVTRKAEALWSGWANSVECDWHRRLKFPGIEQLAMTTLFLSGGVLARKVPIRTSLEELQAGIIPLRVRLLEPDYVDKSKDGVGLPGQAEGTVTIQGVEIDGEGTRTAYWLFKRHPGSSTLPPFGGVLTWSERVPASEVLHAYRSDRPDQVHGVPWLAAAIARLQDEDRWEDAKLMQQLVAACFGGIVRDMDGTSSPIGQPDPLNPMLESLEPGMIQYLRPGQDITFVSPPQDPGANDVQKMNLHRIAVSTDTNYQDATGDYSQATFSSARMGRIVDFSVVKATREHVLAPFLDGIWRWVMETAVAAGQMRYVPEVDWSSAPPPAIEPDTEAVANKHLVRSGEKTLFQIWREKGLDPMTMLDEHERVANELDERGLVFDSDPRKVNDRGMAQKSDPAAVAAEDAQAVADAASRNGTSRNGTGERRS